MTDIELARFRREQRDPGPSAGTPTYSVSLWDMDEQAWVEEFTGLSKWGLRAAIREVRARGYSSVSFAIDRES